MEKYSAQREAMNSLLWRHSATENPAWSFAPSPSFLMPCKFDNQWVSSENYHNYTSSLAPYWRPPTPVHLTQIGTVARRWGPAVCSCRTLSLPEISKILTFIIFKFFFKFKKSTFLVVGWSPVGMMIGPSVVVETSVPGDVGLAQAVVLARSGESVVVGSKI